MNDNVKKTRMRKIGRFAAWILVVFAVFLLILKIVFELNKDNLKTYLITSINKNISGEVTAASIDFSPLYHFPHFSLRLNEVELHENPVSERSPGDDPICTLDRFYIGLDIISLLQGDLNISEISVEGGILEIIVRPDSSVNIKNILSAAEQMPDSTAADAEAAEFNLNKLVLSDFRLVYEDMLSGYRSDIVIKHAENLLTVKGQNLDVKLVPEIEILALEKHGSEYLQNTQLEMALNLEMDLDSLTGKIGNSSIVLAGAALNIRGTFDFRNNYYVDLQISSLLNDPSLLLLIFDEEAVRRNLESIEKGDITFAGRITGNIGDQIPFVELKFGVKDLNLTIPDTRREIRNFGFDGYFTTGNEPDLSAGVLRISNISSTGPAGTSQADLEIQNFVRPQVNLNIDAIIEMTHMERALKFLQTPVYSGILGIKGNIRAGFDQGMRNVIYSKGKLDLDLNNCSFLIRNTGEICHSASGLFHWQDSTIKIENFELKAPGNHFVLNGSVTNLISRWLGVNCGLSARVNLTGDSLALKTFITDDDAAPWIRNEFCQNMDIDLEFRSDARTLSKSTILPAGTIKLNQLKIALTNVSDVAIYKGEIVIGSDRLDFHNIRADIEANRVIFSGWIENYPDLFANEFDDSCRIGIDLRSGQFRLKDFFTYKSQNYLPGLLAENMYNKFRLSAVLTLPQDADSLSPANGSVHLKVKNLDALNTRTGAEIRDLAVHALYRGHDLTLQDISGYFWKTRFNHSRLDLVNLFAPDDDLRIHLDLNCDTIDIGKWLSNAIKFDSTHVTETLAVAELKPVVEQISIPRLDISAQIGRIIYDQNYMRNFRATLMTQRENTLHIDTRDSTWWMPDFDLTAQINSDTLKTDYFKIPQASDSIVSSKGVIEIFPSYRGMFGAEGTGHIWVDISEKYHNYRIQYAISKYKIETMLRRFEQNPSMSGIVTMSLDLKLDKEDLARLNGEIKLSGENITLYNIDIDDFLSRFKRTQNFNLIDISAFMLAGPAGALVTKASDYAILFNLDPTKQTLINKFVSKWKVEAGRFMADDVALTTAKSRIAIKGGLDLYRNEFVGFTLAVVDEKGCPVISQAILGKLDKPQLQKVDAVGTILAPVTNVLKLFTTTNCEPFYTGSVPHPGAK